MAQESRGTMFEEIYHCSPGRSECLDDLNTSMLMAKPQKNKNWFTSASQRITGCRAPRQWLQLDIKQLVSLYQVRSLGKGHFSTQPARKLTKSWCLANCQLDRPVRFLHSCCAIGTSCYGFCDIQRVPWNHWCVNAQTRTEGTNQGLLSSTTHPCA